MLKGVCLKGISSSVPEKIISNLSLEEIMDTQSDWIEERTGIKERRVCDLSNSEDTLYLSVECSKKAIKNKNPEDIDLIIVATSTPDFLYPNTACRLQARIGAKNAVCFDLSAACSGFVYALVTASQFLQLGTYRNALIVGVDIHSKFIDWKDRNTAILFGDAAGAVYIESCELSENQLIAYQLESNGYGSSDLTLKTIGTHYPLGKIEKNVETVFMNGKKIYQFAVQNLPEIIKKTVAKANLKIQDLDILLFHQANQRILDSVMEKLELPKSKCPSNMSKYGNTSAASIPLIWHESCENFPEEALLCLSGFGAGLTIGSIIWKWKKLD